MNQKLFLRRTTLVLLFFCALILLVGCSRSEDGESLPEIPELRYVYDETGILKNETKQHIIAENEALQSRTGTQITVACVRDTGEKTISEYTRELFLAWEIGSSGEETGVLLLLCPREDGYWCLQSQELETLLSSDTIARILRQSLEPHFLSGNYDEGVRAVFDALVNVLSPTPATSPETSAPPTETAVHRESNSNILAWAVIVVLILLLILHFVLVSEKTPRRQKRRTIYSSPRPRRVNGTRPNPVRRPVPPPSRTYRSGTTRPNTSRSSGNSVGTRRR